MSDHESITWRAFMDAEFPDPVPGASETLMAIRAVREIFTPEVLGGFMKWGMPFIKDMTTYCMYNSCLQTVRGPEKAMHVTRVPLGKVDWTFMEKLFAEGEVEYRAHLRVESREEHMLQGWLDSLEYAMAGKLPGVEKPGDFHIVFMKPPSTN